MALSPDPKSPGRWLNLQWNEGDPGTFAVIVGVSEYDHLPGGPGRTARTTYNLRQLHVSAMTAFRFFQWLSDSYAIKDCPLAKCWLLLSPTRDEIAAVPGLGKYMGRPTFDNITVTVNEWFQEMLGLSARSAER